MGAPPISLVIDDLGIYYDASRPSRLETILTEIDLDAAGIDGAGSLLTKLRGARLSKYTPPVPRRDFGRDYVVVVDQTRGDASIRGAGAGSRDFARMLAAARSENPGKQIIVKSHPDVLAGRKSGHFDSGDLKEAEHFLIDDVNPWDLLDHAAAVYTVSSQLGYEAILAGAPVRVFGQSFYSGWGLTADETRPLRRDRQLTVTELFSGAHMQYPIYYDPWRDRLCGLATAIAVLQAERDSEQPASDTTGEVFAGVRMWKRRAVAGFRPRLPRRPRFADDVAAAKRIAKAEERQAWFWAAKAPLSAVKGLPNTGFVEDGFLRSLGLGAKLHEPASLVFDRRGIYFDPSGPSDLEDLIAKAAAGGGDCRRAAALREQIVASRLTKYNVGSRPDAAGSAVPLGRKVLLVPGQVEDDASILRGCGRIRTNQGLLTAARHANPNAWLIYKPHPDVEAGLRTGAIDPITAALADEIAMQTSADALLGRADEVWTLTSLMGFEALLRGKSVTCLGAPFYAGWGLTTDLGPAVPRRVAKPALDDLVWAALIAYPKYRDPLTGLPCGPELIVERFSSGIATRQATALSRLQGLFAGYSRIWR